MLENLQCRATSAPNPWMNLSAYRKNRSIVDNVRANVDRQFVADRCLCDQPKVIIERDLRIPIPSPQIRALHFLSHQASSASHFVMTQQSG
jgi:hypothetical protein